MARLKPNFAKSLMNATQQYNTEYQTCSVLQTAVPLRRGTVIINSHLALNTQKSGKQLNHR